MTKTIEEAAKEFADREYEIGQVDWDALYKGYYHGMKGLFSQPLASRMTEEEKERVRKLYINANDKLKICLNAMNYNLVYFFSPERKSKTTTSDCG